MSVRILTGDNADILPALAAESIDAIVTDPPAGIAFMGKSWDHHKGGRDQWIAWMTGVMAECHRVLKPGGHALVWALPRTSHWTATAIEDAGFEIRDICLHLFGSGFPKSLDVGKAIDKAAGAEREVLGVSDNWRDSKRDREQFGSMEVRGDNAGQITAPATDAARQWDGWGTALKPAAENWILARKPLASTVAANVLTHGTGALNVDASRIGTGDDRSSGGKSGNGAWGSMDAGYERPTAGRWPPNVILDPTAAAMLDEMSGERIGSASASLGTGDKALFGARSEVVSKYQDRGGASRFYPILPVDDPDTLRFLYCPKASRAERNAGLDGMPERERGAMQGNLVNCQRLSGKGEPIKTPVGQNVHPTVKPLQLMRWLVRLVTPPGGTVLDPFAGSGSTGVACVHEGFHFIGIEQDETYAEIAQRRIDHATEQARETSNQPAQLMLTGDD